MSLQELGTTMTARNAMARLAASVVCLFVLIPAAAGAYPDRIVKWVVPSTPGGGTDKITRVVMPKMSEYLRQTIIIENRPGASGNIGAEYVAKAAPDGYTLLTCIGSHTSNAALMKNVPFDLAKDFTPVSLMVIAPSMLIGNPSLPARNVKELIALAKANPGKLEYASGGVGSIQHMSMELLLTMSGQKMLHVPYKATHPALMDVIAGHVPLMVIATTSALPQARAGRVRIFGVTSAKRVIAAPDIPTIAEQGMPGYEAIQWFGMLLPAGTSKDIATRLHAGVVQALNDADMKKLLVADGVEPAPSANPEQFGAFIRSELQKWAKVVKEGGIKAE
ncbi:MAG: Bug family tripartite tricarboxylate transporter substrate binding protein [Burkholderiales bacterium]